jgi:hypothetical protein
MPHPQMQTNPDIALGIKGPQLLRLDIILYRLD